MRFLTEDSKDVRSQHASLICEELRTKANTLTDLVMALGEWLTSTDVERRKASTALLMEVGGAMVSVPLPHACLKKDQLCFCMMTG